MVILLKKLMPKERALIVWRFWEKKYKDKTKKKTITRSLWALPINSSSRRGLVASKRRVLVGFKW